MTSSSGVIADFAVRTSLADVPPDVAEGMQWLLLDSFACAFAATTYLPEAGMILETSTVLGGGDGSTILGSEQRAAPASAAFVNGGLIHGLNYDALGASYAHVAAGVVPATLAVAEAAECTGSELLSALVVAAEVSARLTEAARDPLSVNGWLMGQLLSAFSSALGASKAMRLDAAQTRSALGLALMQAGGTTQVMADGGVAAKSVYASFPAMSGVIAAGFAHHGLDGSTDAFDGPAGLFRKFAPQGDSAALIHGLGDEWLSRELVFKRWPNSAVAHPFLQTLVDGENGRRRAVSVRFRVSRDRAAFFDPERTAWLPSSVGSAGNSVPYAVACHLTRGAFDLDSLRSPAFSDGAVVRLLANTSVLWRDDPTSGRDNSGADDIMVEFDDGSTFVKSVDLARNGAPEPGDDLLDKLRSCARRAAHPFGDSQVDELVSAVTQLPDANDLGRLRRALSRGVRP